MISNFRIAKLCMRKSIINLILPEAQSFCTLRNLIWFWSLKVFSNILFYFCESSNNQFCHHFRLQILDSPFIFNFAYKNGQFFSKFVFFLYYFSNGKSQYIDSFQLLHLGLENWIFFFCLPSFTGNNCFTKCFTVYRSPSFKSLNFCLFCPLTTKQI